MKRLYTFMLSAALAVAASAAIPVRKAPANLTHAAATEVVSPLIGGLQFRAEVPQQTLAASVKQEAQLQTRQTKSRAEQTHLEGGQLKRVAKAPRKAEGTGSKFDGTYTMTAGEWYLQSQSKSSVPVEVELTVSEGVAVISNSDYLVSDVMALLDEETGVMTFVNYFVGTTTQHAVSFMPFIYANGISFDSYSIQFNEETESFDIPADHGISWPAWNVADIDKAKAFEGSSSVGYYDIFDLEGLAKKNQGSGSETEEGWKSIGEGEWFEGLLYASNPWSFPQGLSWKIDVEESETTPGLYRIKPYASDNYLSENFRDEEDGLYDEETVLYINATDPNKVYTTAESNFFPYEMCKFIGNNPENGQSGNVYGTLADGVINFPEGAFYLDDEYAGKVLLESGSSFKIVLPVTAEPKPEWESIGMGEWYEGLLNVFYTDVPDGWHWPVEILESTETPGMYKLYPYAADSPLSELLGGQKDTNCEVIVNATNPAQVFITNDFSPYGLKTFASVTRYGVNTYGSLEEKVISFPNKAFAYVNGSNLSFVNGGGDFKIALPGGVVRNYTLKATTTDICPTSATSTVKIQAGADIATIYATILGGKYNASAGNNAQIITMIGSQLEPGDFSFDTPTESGLYSIMVAGVNADGDVVAAATTYQVIDAENDADWAVVPNTKATYTEGFLSGMFSDVDPEDFEVVLEENVNTPGRFRFESPYAKHSMQFPVVDHSSAHKHYIYVNATDPEKVYVEFSPIGVNMNGFGSVYGFSVPALYAGTEDFESVEETEFGKYTDGKITAPARTSFNNEPYALSNYISEFTLTIEKTAPVETWKSIGEGEWFEGLLHASNPWGFPEGLSWKIDVEESETTPGLYRIKPYASDNYLSENFRDEEDGLYDEETVLYINATDPSNVYTTAESNFFPYGMCKFIGNNPENGQSGSVYGTLTDGVISFPEGAFYLDDEYAGKVLLESGSSFQIILPGSTEPEPEWKSIGKGNWVDGFFTDQSYVMLKENINNVWEVEIEESTATPGIYRVLPYADGTIGSDAGHMREADNENYFVVNATNPDSVYVMGNFTPFNKFKFYQKCPEAAEDFDAEHDEPQYGKLANGEIFFPIGSFTKIYEDGDYTANTDGILMLVLPGTELKDYQLVASTNLCHDSDQAAINFSIVGSGIASARTTTVAGHYIFPEDVEGEPVAVDLTAETIDHKVSNPVGGNTTIVEALDANGNVRRKLTVYHFNNNDVTGWHAVEGKIAKVTEATLFPAIDDVASQEITCTIEEKDGTPGMYRLVNTYADHSLALDHKERHNHYLYIDATDPDYVILVPSATGIGSVKYGDFYLTNEACIYDQIGFKEFAKENGMCGTMENDVIDLGNVKYAANNRWRGAWISAGDDEVYNITVELVDDSGISEISSDSETDAVYYNIRGQRIASPTVPGFYIRNNTKVYIK